MPKSFVPEQWIVRKKLRELRRNMTYSRQKLEELQLQKFRRLVRYINKHSPYYAGVIRRYGIVLDSCRPSDFPVMTKAEVMDNFDQLVTDRRITKQAVSDFFQRTNDPAKMFLGKFHAVHSSGSSQDPGIFIYHRSDWLRGLTSGLRLQPLHNLFQPRKYAFYGSTKCHCVNACAVSAGVHSPKKNDIRLFDIEDPITNTIHQLNEFNPDGLGGYTTGVKMLAEKQRQGMLKISPKWVEVSAETMTKSDKQYLEETFGCGVYQLYGCSEHLLMAVETPGDRDMTLYDDDLICEFREDHIVVTNLFNRILPLIRYRTYDILSVDDSDRGPGPYRKIKSLIGRADTAAVFINAEGEEDFISAVTLEHPFDGLSRLQLRQIDQESFALLISLRAEAKANSPAITDNVRNYMREILVNKRMSNVSFHVVAVDEIPVDPKTRKFSTVLSAERRDVYQDVA